MIGGYRWPDGAIDDGRFVVLFFLFDVMISVRYLSWYLFRIENFILAPEVHRPQYSSVLTPEYLMQFDAADQRSLVRCVSSGSIYCSLSLLILTAFTINTETRQDSLY